MKNWDLFLFLYQTLSHAASSCSVRACAVIPAQEWMDEWIGQAEVYDTVYSDAALYSTDAP